MKRKVNKQSICYRFCVCQQPTTQQCTVWNWEKWNNNKHVENLYNISEIHTFIHSIFLCFFFFYTMKCFQCCRFVYYMAPQTQNGWRWRIAVVFTVIVCKKKKYSVLRIRNISYKTVWWKSSLLFVGTMTILLENMNETKKTSVFCSCSMCLHIVSRKAIAHHLNWLGKSTTKFSRFIYVREKHSWFVLILTSLHFFMSSLCGSFADNYFPHECCVLSALFFLIVK